MLRPEAHLFLCGVFFYKLKKFASNASETKSVKSLFTKNTGDTPNKK